MGGQTIVGPLLRDYYTTVKGEGHQWLMRACALSHNTGHPPLHESGMSIAHVKMS